MAFYYQLTALQPWCVKQKKKKNQGQRSKVNKQRDRETSSVYEKESNCKSHLRGKWFNLKNPDHGKL